jgi:serine/threonine-protein kinase
VKHPNVVNITDVGVWEDLPYLIMELLEGEDLESYLGARGTLSESELADLMMPVVAGLDAAHRSGVVHRDLKPSNIFLSRDPQGEILPKILDFGISKLATPRERDLRATVEGELMGSPIYMSPEAAVGARDVTARSDQYSLGVILYECVTGQVPFEGEALLPLLKAITSGVFPSPRSRRSDLSVELDAAIVRAMSLRPDQRFDGVQDLGKALWQLSEGRSRLLWSPSFGTAPSRSAHKAAGPLSRASAQSMRAVVRDGGPRSDAPPPPARARRAVLAVAAAVLLAAALWALRPASELPPPSAASSLPEPALVESATAVELRAPSEVNDPPLLPASDDPVEPASDDPVEPEPAPSKAVASTPPSAARRPRAPKPAARASRTNKRRAKATPASRDNAPRRDTSRSGAEAARQQAVREPQVVGANESPILD